MDDLEEFKMNVSQMSDEQCCEIIAANRYLGIMADEAIVCMKELAARRSNGNDFFYENRIEELIESLPKFKLDINKLFKLPKIL